MIRVQANNARSFSSGQTILLKRFERRINCLLLAFDWLTRKLKEKNIKKAIKGRSEGKKNRDKTRMISSDSLFFVRVTLQKKVEMPSGTSDRAGAQRLYLSHRSCQALYDHTAGVYCSMSHCLNKVTNKTARRSPIVNRAG